MFVRFSVWLLFNRGQVSETLLSQPHRWEGPFRLRRWPCGLVDAYGRMRRSLELGRFYL